MLSRDVLSNVLRPESGSTELLNDQTGAGLGMTVAGLGITVAGLGSKACA
jgi:hypothetical protein